VRDYLDKYIAHKYILCKQLLLGVFEARDDHAYIGEVRVERAFNFRAIASFLRQRHVGNDTFSNEFDYFFFLVLIDPKAFDILSLNIRFSVESDPYS